MPHVDVGTHRLWVTDKGSGSPVVLLHPLFFDSRVFEPLVDRLVEEHRVLAVDVRDHGRSEGPPSGWTLRQAAAEIERATDELGVDAAHVIGVSMGGMIALRWVLANPDSVRSLGLVSTSAEAEPRAWLHKAMVETVRVAGRPAARVLMPYSARRMFSEEVRGRPDVVEWRRRIRTMDPGALYRAGQAVFDREPILEEAEGIEAPALVLAASGDPAIPPDHGRRLADALSQAEIVELDSEGHVLPLEEPEAMGEEVVHFLRRAEARTTPPEG